MFFTRYRIYFYQLIYLYSGIDERPLLNKPSTFIIRVLEPILHYTALNDMELGVRFVLLRYASLIVPSTLHQL